MTQSISERIQMRMKELKISQADLIRMTGAGRASVSNWVNGLNNPSAKHIHSLAKCLHTTSSWLLTGDDTIKNSISFQNIESWDDTTPLGDDEIEIRFFKDFHFACGLGNEGEALDNEVRRLRLSKATLRRLNIEGNNAIATTAEGDSMATTIRDGDTIHIDLGRKKIKDGKIFAVCHGGLFKAKRLYNLPFGGIRVVSDNAEEFPEEHLTAEEVKEQEFEILGWIWSWQTLESW